MEAKINKLVELLNDTYGNENRNFTVTKGKKYFKVWSHNYNQQCIYAFVDGEGNIYMPAGCNAPAKGVRGTIEEPLKCCGKYGVNYKRGNNIF